MHVNALMCVTSRLVFASYECIYICECLCEYMLISVDMLVQYVYVGIY